MLEKFERYPLTFGPTPIERLGRLSEHLGGTVEIYAMRELRYEKLMKRAEIVPRPFVKLDRRTANPPADF